MIKKLIGFAVIFSSILSIAYADPPVTTSIRHPLFSNAKTKVWETIIYPDANQKLTMHRHEYDRIVIALTDGVLKVTNDKGKSHTLKLNQGQAYYLSRDLPNELHTDENLGQHPVKVIVVELHY